MYKLRSSQSTEGRKMAGARSLWRANGMKEEHFGKPIIAVVNSFTQFVPGHAHLHKAGQYVKEVIESMGCFAAEFNTIAIDDGIAMGHDGMLYSLPSRELIADSVEYMCNAHKVDAMICISNCDKITPGMMMAALRLNIPAVFVSGGPMEAGHVGDDKYDLVDVMVKGADEGFAEDKLDEVEKKACPTCGCCSGMFTANSMNCLTEALGLSLVGNGTLLATHIERKKLMERAAKQIVKNTLDYYNNGNDKVLPRSIATKESFMNAMTLDIAMGGSTNTVLHLLAAAYEAEVDFKLEDIDALSRKTPVLCKVSPNSRYHMEDVNRAGGIMGILSELAKESLIDDATPRVDYPSLCEAMSENSIFKGDKKYLAAPCRRISLELGTVGDYFETYDDNRESGCIRSVEHAYTKDGGLAVLFGNLAPRGAIVKTAGVDKSILNFKGKAVVFESQEEAVNGILSGKVESGNVVIIRYEGPKGGPGMQEMLYPTSYLKSMHLDKECALLTDGRFSGGTSGLSIGHASPEAASGGVIALVEDGDDIVIDIPTRKIELLVSSEELAVRAEKCSYKPKNRDRVVSKALRAYASMVLSADQGAVREIKE